MIWDDHSGHYTNQTVSFFYIILKRVNDQTKEKEYTFKSKLKSWITNHSYKQKYAFSFKIMRALMFLGSWFFVLIYTIQ